VLEGCGNPIERADSGSCTEEAIGRDDDDIRLFCKPETRGEKVRGRKRRRGRLRGDLKLRR
jgi:hypothetical protein